MIRKLILIKTVKSVVLWGTFAKILPRYLSLLQIEQSIFFLNNDML